MDTSNPGAAFEEPVFARTTRREPARSSEGLGREGGSAYIVALLVLIVLSIVGLSLVLVTQTEMQIGANDQTLHQTFYASDAGINVSTALALASGDYLAPSFVFNQRSPLPNVNVADRVDVSRFMLLSYQCCNYCPCEDDTEKFVKALHGVTATSTHVAWRGAGLPPADAPPRAQKTLSVMIEFQPWPEPPSARSGAFPLNEQEAAKVKF